MVEIGIIFFAIVFLLFICIQLTQRKPFYISKTGKPFEEYDADGYLTPESYQSHIKHYTDGVVEVDLGALVKTRRWKEDMEACRKMREYLQNKKS